MMPANPLANLAKIAASDREAGNGPRSAEIFMMTVAGLAVKAEGIAELERRAGNRAVLDAAKADGHLQIVSVTL